MKELPNSHPHPLCTHSHDKGVSRQESAEQDAAMYTMGIVTHDCGSGVGEHAARR